MFLSTLTSGEEAWIGGQQDSVGVWSWSDGRNWNFTSWATGRVDTLIFGKCVHIIYFLMIPKFILSFTLILEYHPRQQANQTMVEEIRSLSPQTLVQMASGMTTTEIPLHNLYVSITQVLNTKQTTMINTNVMYHCVIL